MKRYAFIYNPAARGGKAERQLARLQQYIGNHETSTLYRSKRQGDITELVELLKSDYDVFVACGGDGTVREVAAALVHSDKEMGIVPMGTGNDFCKSVNIPNNLSRAIQLLYSHPTTAIDVGKCNDFIFVNVLGFGFDGLTNRYAHEMKRLPSVLQYAIAALKATFTHQSFNVETVSKQDINTERNILISFANGRVEGGSFWIAPNASVIDRRLNLVTIRKTFKWLIPFLLPLFLFKKGNWLPQITSTLIKEFRFSLEEPVAIHADGEIIETEEQHFTITTLPGALELICGL